MGSSLIFLFIYYAIQVTYLLDQKKELECTQPIPPLAPNLRAAKN